jgi:hypothetical protein
MIEFNIDNAAESRADNWDEALKKDILTIESDLAMYMKLLRGVWCHVSHEDPHWAFSSPRGQRMLGIFSADIKYGVFVQLAQN